MYELTSTKGSKTINGDLAAAFRAAIEMEAELQPSFGITIDGDGRTFECENGRIAVASTAGDEDDEAGAVMLVDGELVISWQQGARTPFFDRQLAAA